MFKFIFPTFNLNIERWKWNKEYRIYVSNMGHFCDEYKRPIKNMIDGKGYIRIKTAVGLKSAHRLVMLTWKPIPNAEELTVDHLDHNKRNNALSNLEWVSNGENLRRAALDYISPGSDNEETKAVKIPNLKFQAKETKKKKYVFDNPVEAAIWLKSQKNFINSNPNNKNLSIEEIAKTIAHKTACGATWYYKWSYIIK